MPKLRMTAFQPIIRVLLYSLQMKAWVSSITKECFSPLLIPLAVNKTIFLFVPISILENDEIVHSFVLMDHLTAKNTFFRILTTLV